MADHSSDSDDNYNVDSDAEYQAELELITNLHTCKSKNMKFQKRMILGSIPTSVVP